MRRLIVAGLFLIAAGFTLYGQSTAPKFFKVQYVDGKVEMQLKGQTKWNPLQINTLVAVDATVRLAEGATVELMLDKTRVSLIKAGTYPMASLASKVKTSTGTRLGARVAQKVAMIVTDSSVPGSEGHRSHGCPRNLYK